MSNWKMGKWVGEPRMWLSFPFDPETIERIKEDIPGALYRGQAVGFRIAAERFAAADSDEGNADV